MSRLGIVAIAGLLLVGCSQSSYQVEAPPADGVHITGAVKGLYPITDGGTCSVNQVPAGRQLVFSPNPRPGDPTFGAVIANFAGHGVYANVSLFVSASGRTWSTNDGEVVVKSSDAAQAEGTVTVHKMQEATGGNATIDATGSWTCRMVSAPEATPTPTGSPDQLPSPGPSPAGTPVEKQILPPATDFPVGNLCSSPLQYTANGNATPLFCRKGEINVLAWKFYAQVSSSILGLGLNPTAGQVQAAMCDDITRSHATRVEEANAYSLATAYYGWTFNIDPSRVTCQ